jgi:hypothetical protein
MKFCLVFWRSSRIQLVCLGSAIQSGVALRLPPHSKSEVQPHAQTNLARALGARRYQKGIEECLL